MKCEDCKWLRDNVKLFGKEYNHALPAQYGDHTSPCNRYPQNIMRAPKEPACGEFKPKESEKVT